MKDKRTKYVPLTESTMPLFTSLLSNDLSVLSEVEINKRAIAAANDASSSVFIQLRDGKPSGYFKIRHQKGINEVGWIFVSKEFKGKGLSRKMFKEALRISRVQRVSLFANPIGKLSENANSLGNSAKKLPAERAADSLGKMLQADYLRSQKQKLGVGKFARKKH